MTDATALLSEQRAFVVAPAGCGKTRLIADAVQMDASHRSLVLTHTHAGVDALRRRLKEVGANASSYEVETIAGWSLRLATSFPATSGVVTERPSNAEWKAVYRAASHLLTIEAIKAVVRASFDAVYVDEYQDCSPLQHDTVLKLVAILPVRIVGDPLQGIFDFAGEGVVDWPTHVEPNFSELPPLVMPHRWAQKNPVLGAWLGVLRELLEGHQPVDLRQAPTGSLRFVTLPADPKERGNVQMSMCNAATCSKGETLLAIHAWEPQCHRIARQTAGKFRSLETMECDALFETAEAFDRADRGHDLARAVFAFACLCLTHVKTALEKTATRLIEGHGLLNRQYQHKEQLDAIAAVVAAGSLTSAREALLVLGRTKSAAPARHELYHEMLDALREHETGRHVCLRDAAVRSRDRTRRTGRTLGRFIVGRTLLVKGLEFDHALVLDASELNRKNLYVALTRASRTLTVLAPSPVLTPH